MQYLWLHCLSSLISISISIEPTGDLTCNPEAWTVVSAEWIFPQNCVYENTNPINGAMSWIGDAVPDSLNWSDYTVEMVMTPTNVNAGGANGGLAFNIQEVGVGSNSGKFYAISIFPTFREDQVEIHMGKWNNRYSTVGTWFMDNTYVVGQSFLIKAVINTIINVTVDIYVNSSFIATWIEDTEPMFTHGSIGIRSYMLPANYTSICVNGCVIPPDDQCVWKVGDKTLNLTVIEGIVFNKISDNNPQQIYSLSPCSNSIKCNGENCMSAIGTGTSCIQTIARWD
eukprot:60886_1